MSTISHKLRTPLNSILGFSELLLDQDYGPLNAKQVRYLRNIHRSGSHLLSLLNDLIDFMRLKWGEVDVDYTEFSVSKTIDQSLMAFKAVAEQKGVVLQARDPEVLLNIKADEIKLTKIMHHLLSNAVKFTPSGGKIEVTTKLCKTPPDRYLAHRSPCFLEISVADTGIGINPEDLETIFSPFYQGDPSVSQEIEGTGLGLTVARELVRIHGGTMWVESEEKKGSTFTFILPIPDK